MAFQNLVLNLDSLPWLAILAGFVSAIFLFALLWKILRSEEGFLFGYGNWVVGKWQPGKQTPDEARAAREAKAEAHTASQPAKPAADVPQDGHQRVQHVLTLSRLLDGDLAYLMMSDEWESKILRALQTIVSGITRVVDPNGRCRCGFFILDEAGECLILAAGEGYHGSRQPRLTLDHSCAGRAFQTGEDYYCKDISTDPVYWDSVRGNRDYRSIACVPVRAGRNVFGVICLDAPEANAFTAEEFHYLEVFAAKLAVFCAFHTLQVMGVCSIPQPTQEGD